MRTKRASDACTYITLCEMHSAGPGHVRRPLLNLLIDNLEMPGAFEMRFYGLGQWEVEFKFHGSLLMLQCWMGRHCALSHKRYLRQELSRQASNECTCVCVWVCCEAGSMSFSGQFIMSIGCRILLNHFHNTYVHNPNIHCICSVYFEVNSRKCVPFSPLEWCCLSYK